MAVIAPIHLRGWRFILLNGAIGLANIVGFQNTHHRALWNTAFPILSNVPGYTILAPYGAGNFQGLTPSFGTWGTTDHMFGLALGFPIAKWLAARFGDYHVYRAALVIYATISFFCATSDTIVSFVAMRFLLGLTGGVILPVGQAVLLGKYPPKQRTLGVGIWGVLSMMPFTIGVFMGGFYAEFFGWRTLIYSNVVIALTVASVGGSLVYGRRIKRNISRFDSIGFILLALIFGGIQTILNQGIDFDWFGWSRFLFTLLAMVAVALPCFVIWELGRTAPRDRFGAIRLPQLHRRRGLLCSWVPFDPRPIVGLHWPASTAAWLFLVVRGPRLRIDDRSFHVARGGHP